MAGNPPKRHHFLPVFYLKRWAGPDRRIVEFSKPYGEKVKPRKTFPAGTAYAADLYSFEGVPPDQKQLVESVFFGPADGRAADALALLESDQWRNPWPNALRQIWATFMVGLLVRMPDDIAALKELYTEGWYDTTPAEEAEYQTGRSANDPETLLQLLKSVDATFLNNAAIELLPKFAAEIENLLLTLMNMRWIVTNVPDGNLQLLTSDRPLLRSPLGRPDALWQLPIGPRKMFWAVKDRDAERQLSQNLRPDWVRLANQEALKRANRLAFASNDAPLRFVQKHLASDPEPSIFRRIRATRAVKCARTTDGRSDADDV